MYPESCKAGHFNLIRAFAPTYSKNPLLALQHSVQPYSEKEKAGFARSKWFDDESRGKCA